MNPETVPTRGHAGTAALLGLLAASLFFSTALVNIAALLVSSVALVHWFRHRPFSLLREPVPLACLAFLAWVMLRELLAGQSPVVALRSANEFRPLLYIVLWAPLFCATWHRQAVIGVCATGLLVYGLTAVATVLVTGKAFYMHHVNVAALQLPALLGKFYTVLLHRSADLSGPVMVLAIFGSLQLALDGAQRRRLWLLLATVCTCALLFSSARRTSQLAFVLCAALFVVLNARRLDWRAGLGLVAALLLSVGLVAASPTASKGVRQVLTDVREFLATPDDQRGRLWSSGGERLRYWTVARDVALEAPLVGTALSRYPERFRAHEQAKGGSHKPQSNPHNEYLFVLGAFGAIGLLAYLAVHGAVVRHALRMPDPTRRKILLLFMVATLTSLFINSMVVDMIPGHFFALALLVLGGFGAASPAQEAAA